MTRPPCSARSQRVWAVVVATCLLALLPTAPTHAATPTLTGNATVTAVSSGGRPDVRVVGTYTVTHEGFGAACELLFTITPANGDAARTASAGWEWILPEETPKTVEVNVRYSQTYGAPLLGTNDVVVTVSCGSGDVTIELGRATVVGPAFSITVPTRWWPDAMDSYVPTEGFRISFSAPQSPVTITVSTGTGAVVAKATSQQAETDWGMTIKVRKGTYGGLTVEVRSGDLVVRQSTFAHRGWAPLEFNETTPTFRPCSTVTWSYDRTGAPKGGDVRLRQELGRVFADYGALTGLTFVEGAPGAAQSIIVRWGNVGGSLATGGWASDQVNGTRTVLGTVTISPRQRIMRTPGFRYPQRGPVLYHEVAHVLGLGHVASRASMMYGRYSKASALKPGKAEREGLRLMYQPQTCSGKPA